MIPCRLAYLTVALLLAVGFAFAQKPLEIKVNTKKCTIECSQAKGVELEKLYKLKGGALPLKYKWSTPVVNQYIPNPTVDLKRNVTVTLVVTDAFGKQVKGEFPFTLINCTESTVDTDQDGIWDTRDSCKKDPGPAKYNGCPDRDEDGVIDRFDECPDTPGKPELNGCPDMDNDGIPDKVDICPDLPGTKAHQGCPDTDEDGVWDTEDRCLKVKGPKENLGCPWPDTDGDGFNDHDDACPKLPGIAANNGCPPLTTKEQQIIQTASERIEFETGSDVLSEHSYRSLNALVNFLFNKPMCSLRIEGHTDNRGGEETNLDLSQRRANAVRQYLIDQGVKATRLVATGFGSNVPLADNETWEGRKKNRRVEMKIIFGKLEN